MGVHLEEDRGIGEFGFLTVKHTLGRKDIYEVETTKHARDRRKWTAWMSLTRP